MRNKPGEILAALNVEIDSITEGFRRELDSMIHGAKARVIGRLSKALTLTDGRADASRANARALRGVAAMFRDELEAAGVRLLIEEFTSTFEGQIPMFAELVRVLGEEAGREIALNWTQADIDLFASHRITVESGLEAVLDGLALAAQRRIAFGIGGLEFGELVETLEAAVRLPVAEAVSFAETAQAGFWRTLTDQGFKKIEADLPPGSLRYRFEGPSDKLTRPFCKRLLDRTRKRGLTRAQIDALDNGQLPNVFITAGGWRCRHQWIAEIAPA